MSLKILFLFFSLQKSSGATQKSGQKVDHRGRKRVRKCEPEKTNSNHETGCTEGLNQEQNSGTQSENRNVETHEKTEELKPIRKQKVSSQSKS
jgi:hypothetical protein